MPIDNAIPANVHGVIESPPGVEGLTLLYSVGGTHFRVRLRDADPEGEVTPAHTDAWTLYEWSEVQKPAADAEETQAFVPAYVPLVVREQFEKAVVQVPSPDADDAAVRNAVEDAER